ncbi:unnamed protein product, partial [Meganyctiphanes norvegica]
MGCETLEAIIVLAVGVEDGCGVRGADNPPLEGGPITCVGQAGASCQTYDSGRLPMHLFQQFFQTEMVLPEQTQKPLVIPTTSVARYLMRKKIKSGSGNGAV